MTIVISISFPSLKHIWMCCGVKSNVDKESENTGPTLEPSSSVTLVVSFKPPPVNWGYNVDISGYLGRLSQ